jgi:hypothetical protein
MVVSHRFFSEPAPYDAITLPRAKREFDNARTLYLSGVLTIVPMAVYRYDDEKQFNEYPLGVVLTLAWDESPLSVGVLRVEDEAATDRERAHAAVVRAALGCSPDHLDKASNLSVWGLVGQQIGIRLRHG